MTSSNARGSAEHSANIDMFSTDELTLCGDEEKNSGQARASTDVSEDGHDILESEDERERLLTNESGFFGRTKVRIGSRKEDALEDKHRGRKESGKEREALMYELEEGVGSSNSSLLRNSGELKRRRLAGTTVKRKVRSLSPLPASPTHHHRSDPAYQPRRTLIWRLTIYSTIVSAFIVLLALVYRLSTISKPPSSPATMLSNGTSLFAPTTILISLDGFRADFLNRGLTPTLNGLIENGVSPQYMWPSFPSVTFPNHYTMVTGMYPEAHGVVGNTFWDPALEKEFYYTDADRSLQDFWWGGEPLWRTAERQGVKAAVHMWPGSEAHHTEYIPAYVDKYNGSEALPRKVERVLGLLDLPGSLDAAATIEQPRPQLIAAYVPNVDSHGHKFGPNSTEIWQTIKDVDTMLGSLLQGLQDRNLSQIVNVVVVSDHGMATTDISRLFQFEDLIDPSLVAHIDGWPLYGLRPKNPADLESMYSQLINKTKDNPNLDVYLRDKDMPERYHFSQNERIAPLWIVPKTGWAIVTKEEYDLDKKKSKTEFDIEEAKAHGDVYHPRGLHGYDNKHPLMRAIFVARGPAFPHKPNSRVEPFRTCLSHQRRQTAVNMTNRLRRKHRTLQHNLRLPPHRTRPQQRHSSPPPQTRRPPHRPRDARGRKPLRPCRNPPCNYQNSNMAFAKPVVNDDDVVVLSLSVKLRNISYAVSYAISIAVSRAFRTSAGEGEGEVVAVDCAQGRADRGVG